MKKSTQVALGGLSAALCIMLMFMTGMIPFMTYALPAVSGVILICVLLENGTGTALLVYCTVSLLSLLVVPDREAAIMFIAFFGYYPILKPALERTVKIRPIRFVLKLALFNTAIILAYQAIIYILQIPDILEEFGDFGKYSVPIILGLGNIVFIIYDFALTQLIDIYIMWFRPRILRKIR